MQDDEALCACPVFTSAIAFCLHKLFGRKAWRYRRETLPPCIACSPAHILCFSKRPTGLCMWNSPWLTKPPKEWSRQTKKMSCRKVLWRIHETPTSWVVKPCNDFVEASVVVHVQGLATCRLTSTGFSGVADRWIVFSFSLGFFWDFLLIGEMIQFDKHFWTKLKHEHVCCAPFFGVDIYCWWVCRLTGVFAVGLRVEVVCLMRVQFW